MLDTTFTSMGDTNISSNNQKGGITAQNVNSGSGNFNYNDNREKPKASLWKIIVGVVTFIAAVVAILTYFDIAPF